MTDDAVGGAPPVRGPRDAAAWGLVGALAFLVLHQGYLLAGGRYLGPAPVAATAVGVGVLVGGVGYWLGGRVGGNGQR